MPDALESSVHPKTRAEWQNGLQQNHTRPQGLWLIAKINTRSRYRRMYLPSSTDLSRTG
jgi:hypothetical protein